MKTRNIPSIRVEPDFRAGVEAVLVEGETLSQFVEASERASVERRRMQAEFIARRLRSGIATLKASPFTCRKAGQSPFLRELIVPFERSGYLALFEIEDDSKVAVLAVRHELEDDYH
jgi:hypothetical protein